MSPRRQPHPHSHDSRFRQGSKTSQDKNRHRELNQHHPEDHPYPHPPQHPQTTAPRNISSREMTKVVCSDCGKECEVPFKPTQGRPVYCRDCLPKHRTPRF